MPARPSGTTFIFPRTNLPGFTGIIRMRTCCWNPLCKAVPRAHSLSKEFSNFQPAVSGLVQQVLVIRDQNVAGNPTPGGDIPSWDLTLNNIPIAYPAEVPAVLQMQSRERQLWRVSNSSSDSILDLQFDGVPQMHGSLDWTAFLPAHKMAPVRDGSSERPTF